MVNDETSANFQYGRWLSSPPLGEEVVISGISGKFLQCNNVQELFENLSNKGDLINENNLRWSVQHSEIPKRTGHIPNLSKFDAGFFGLHQRQAENMDPSLRKLLEVSIESVIDAGVHPQELENSRTGVFVAFSFNEVASYKLKKITQPELFALTGYLRSMLPHRISYFLKVKGPSVAVDTACSSTLEALEKAFIAIRSGRCDQALVGAALLTMHPTLTIQFNRMGILNKEGVCRVFDQDAAGYVKGEVVGCIFLQKAKDSKRIYAQIVHCKSNSDGFKSEGQLFPSQKSQCQLLKEVYHECEIEPDQLSYFEAHGTATRVGDEVEVRAIDEAIGKHRKKPLWIGSVKSNLGHSEPASGMASITKVVLGMHSGYICPNLHFKKAKEGINDILQTRLIPVTEKVPLEEDAIVGVSNFGFGGSNAHVVLRRFCKPKMKKVDFSTLLCVSGRTKESVEKLFEDAIQNRDNPEWIALIHNVFKKEFTNHLFRGFIIIRKNKTPITSVRLYSKKSDVCYVKLGKFQKTGEVVEKHFSTLPIFSEKLKKIKKKLVGCYEKSENNHNNFKAISVQLCIVEVLEVLHLTPVVVLDDTLAELRVLRDVIGQNSNNHVDSSHVVFDLSDTNELLLDDPDTILELIGRLYEKGHNPQLQKMYPSVDYPVHSGTPMISPSVRWNHRKNWPVEYYTSLEGTTIDMFEINLNDPQNQYIKGHVIDGRNLFPAAGYLYLVWQVIAAKNVTQLDDCPVVFTNCRFIRATTLTKDTVTLKVTIQGGSGNFDIVTDNAVVVTGTVSHLKEEQLDFLRPEFKENNPKKVMDKYEIYKELNLRGYNYTDQFAGLSKCNLEATEGLIEWQNNWVTFIDNVFQIRMLQMDTRVLCVPTSIQKITIDPVKHLKESSSGKIQLPLIASKKYNFIKSGGVEVYDLLLSAISPKQDVDPLLEKFEFIPNTTSLDLAQSVRINTQIILEETLEDDLKAVEIIDEFTNLENPLYMPSMFTALESIPVVRPDLTISSEKMLQEIPGIKMEFVKLTPTSNLLLIVASKALQQNDRLIRILSSLGKNGFVVSREEKNFVPEKIEGVTILTQHVLENEQLILLRKSVSQDNTYVEMSSTNFHWISELQKCVKNSSNVVVYSQDQQSNGILGFINCIRREPEGRKIKCFFMMDQVPKFDPSDPFYKQQLGKNQAINIYKNSEWGTYRHLLLEEPSSSCREHLYASVTSRGDLSSLLWVEGPLRYDDADDDLVYTYFSALNFKDVMISSARLTIMCDRRIQDCQTGLEYSGRDSRGNRVMGMVSYGGLSNIIRVDPALCFWVPLDWSLEDAATVPCVYATVIYALLMRTTLKPGTSILIHSATGGIGIAALNVALYHGCKVFVTVGTQEKREFLKKLFPQIPDNYIGNSRDTSFEELIKKQTRGLGVDIVLNSLAEEKLQSSIRCLAHGGKFMEIGKFDLMKNNVFDLLLMEKEASYHGIMLDEIFQSTTERKLVLKDEICKGIKAGYVKPLPRKVFDHDKVANAFKYMANGTHIGKILIKIRDEGRDEVSAPPQTFINALPRFYCDPEKSYIILGGLGGFGLELADWLVLRGARKLILTSRFGVQTGYQSQRIKLWTSYGACVIVFTTSASSKEEYLNLVEESNNMGPTDGIFNLAVILEDALFEDQTEEKFVTALTPKAQATIFLDEISRKHCPDLRYFVVFSSVSCGRGNAGQTNYGMANSVMERICEKRKQDGLPGLAIQWGAVGDVGLVAKMQKENKELVIGGTLQQRISNCLKVMDLFLNQSNPIVASMVVADKRDKSSGRTPLEAVAKIIGIKNLKTVSYQATLAEMGMDSIMRIEIIQILEKDFGIYITPAEARNLTLTKLDEMEIGKKSQDQNLEKYLDSTNLLTHIPSCEIANTPFVELEQNDGSDITVFIFPGIDGLFASFKPFTQHLRAKVLGVQYNYKSFGNKVESIIQMIVPEIEEHLSKNKQFFFISYSYGVPIALEIARLLENKNYFGKIAAIDGSQQYVSKLMQEFASGETDAEFEASLFYNIAKTIAPMNVLLTLKDQLLRCQNLSQRMKLALSIIPSELMQQHNLQEAQLVIVYKRFKFMKNYISSKEKLKSSIKLYRAELSAIRDIVDDYGLSEICATAVEVMTIGGSHETMLEQNILANDITKFFSLDVA